MGNLRRPDLLIAPEMVARVIDWMDRSAAQVPTLPDTSPTPAKPLVYPKDFPAVRTARRQASEQTGDGLSGGAAVIEQPVAAADNDQAIGIVTLPAVDERTKAEQVSRAGPLRMIEGMCYSAYRGTLGAALALGGARNSPYSSIIAAKNSPTHPAAWAAAYAGVVAYHAAIDPARPFQTLVLAGVVAPAITDRFTAAEREQLLRDGISTFAVTAAGAVAIERAITTYQVNAQNLPDVSWLDINTPLTLAYIRDAVRIRISTRFPRHKLADDGTNFAAGQAIVTPRIIRAELIALFADLEAAGIVEGMAQFKQDLIVERDATDRNRVNALIPPDIVNQLRVFAAQIQYRL